MFRNACLIAATAVCLAACGPSSNNQQPQQQQPATAAPAQQPAPRHERHESRREAPAPRVQAAAPVCSTCGTIAAIRPVRVEGQAGLVGTLGGGAAGGLIGNQFGKGKGNAAMTALGAVAGAVAGAEAQKVMTSKTVYHVTVDMETGGSRTFTLENAAGLAVGSKVNVNGDSISLR